MSKGIALLLRGACGDPSAAIHAVELAKRTTGAVHAVFVRNTADEHGGPREENDGNDMESFSSQLIAFVRWLGEIETVQVHIHMLESMKDELLIRFLCAQRIFYLILGADNPDSTDDLNAWTKKLRIHLREDRNWYLPDLWTLIVKPWDEPTFDRIISRFTEWASNNTTVETKGNNPCNCKGLKKNNC